MSVCEALTKYKYKQTQYEHPNKHKCDTNKHEWDLYKQIQMYKQIQTKANTTKKYKHECESRNKHKSDTNKH